MSGAVREALVLPWSLLLVAGLAGLRTPAPAGALVFVAPPLMSLVLAVIVMGAMAQSGLLVPSRLVHETRGALANGCGVVVLVALLLATAQALSCVTPEAGLPSVLGNGLLLALATTTLAAAPDRQRLLRSLAVLLGAGFVFKYVLLAGLADSDGGLARRLLLAILEGASLGTLGARGYTPATGYVAFGTLLAYLAALTMLPTVGVPDRSGSALATVGDNAVTIVDPGV